MASKWLRCVFCKRLFRCIVDWSWCCDECCPNCGEKSCDPEKCFLWGK